MEKQRGRRRRPALSCQHCRLRKVRCSRTEPCEQCISSKSQCIYKTMDSSEPLLWQQPRGPGAQQRDESQGSTSSMLFGAAPAVLPSHQPSITSTLAVCSDAPHDMRGRDVATTPGVIPNVFSHIDTRPFGHIEPAPDLRDLLRRLEKLEQASVSTTIHAFTETGSDTGVFLNKTRIVKWSTWAGEGHEFKHIVDCYTKAVSSSEAVMPQDPSIKPILVKMGALLQECKLIARNIKVARPSRGLVLPNLNLELPSREMANQMATLYFRSFESAFRIFHEPSFWTEYDRFWDDPHNAAMSTRLKILLVVGIGSSLHKHQNSDSIAHKTIHQWIYAAQTWLAGPLEKGRLDITGLQIYCLTILGRQIYSIGGDLIWMSMGSLIHVAMQMGLHRDPVHLPTMSVLQAEVRRRLWATILELLVQSSLDSTMPPRISFDELDAAAPSNNHDEEIKESTVVLEPHPRTTYTSTSLQLVLLDLLPTRLRILQLLNGLRAEMSYLDVLTLSSDLTAAYQACCTFLRDKGGFGVTAFHRNLLHYLVRRFMIPLHCSFACKARSNPLFHYSLKASLDTAMAIISLESDEKFSYLMATGGGMFRERLKLAASTISLELLTEVEDHRLDGTLQAKSIYRVLLKDALKDVISQSLERVRYGETNIKLHMFLSMVIAQVEAVEEGVSPEQRIIESANRSLELCRGLLLAQVESPQLYSLDDMNRSFDTEQDDFTMDFNMNNFFSGIE